MRADTEQIDELIDSLPRQPYGTGSRREDCRELVREVRKQDDALIQQMHDALCECAEDSQEQLDRMEAAKLRQYRPQAVAYQEAIIDAAKKAITAGRARLEGRK